MKYLLTFILLFLFVIGSNAQIGSSDFVRANTDQVTTSSPVSTATNNYTMSLWVYWHGDGTNLQPPYYNGNSNFNGYGFLFSNRACGSGSHPAVLGGGKGCDIANVSTTITANVWTHLFYVRDAGVNQLYIDGVAEPSFGTTAPNSPTNQTTIGKEATNSFDGLIYDVRFYGKALSSAERERVIRCSNNRFSDLEYQVKLNSTQYKDMSGNGNNGACTNCPDSSPEAPPVQQVCGHIF